jgi:DNA-binding GntR family transcriptional regulator
VYSNLVPLEEGQGDADRARPTDARRRDAATGRGYELLRADVLSGKFAPGEVLLETVLAQSYGLSRTPVREALGRLEQDGFLERGTRGYRVRSGTPQDVLDIYEARSALEAEAAGAAATRRTDLELASLLHIHDRACASDDPEMTRRLNSEWHAALWRASHNRTIQTLLGKLVTQLRIYDRGPHESAGDLAKTRTEHAKVLAALTSRDPDYARRAITDHLARARELRLAAFARNAAGSTG